MSKAADNIGKLLQIGTSRAAFAIDEDLPPALRATLEPYATAAAEQRLWLATGALDLWNRAGYVPGKAASATASASDEESLAPCPPRAEAVLSQLLQGVHPGLYAQWLDLLAGLAARLPARYLPNMLDLGTRQNALREHIVRVLGERGRWLAVANPDWSWATASAGYVLDDEAAALKLMADWQTGTPEQRFGALSAWRQRDPDAARQALATSWASEAPEHRAALLPCLAINLDHGDEAFLEQALADRRKEVRQVAQDLLASLPGSSLSQRMLARLAPVLQLKRPLLGKARFEITLPAERDKAMQRDGVGIGSHARMGEKAGWLADMVAAVGPEHWLTEFHRTPGECLALAAESDFLAALLCGWTTALQRRLDNARYAAQLPASLLAWCYGLGEFWLQADPGTRQLFPASFFAAWKTLPAAEMEGLLMRLIESSPAGKGLRDGALLDLLDGLTRDMDGTWPGALSELVLTRMLGMLPELSPYSWEYWAVLDRLPRLVDPIAIAAFETGLPALDPALARGHDEFAKFFSAVRFRHQMYLSFQEPA
jgi:hypothetical protein